MLDDTQVDGSITASPAADEATSTAAPSQDTGNAAPNSSGDASPAAPVDTGKQPQTDESSLTSHTGPQQAEQKTPAQMDWERRYHDQAKGLGKLQAEVGQLRRYREETQRQYDGIDPNAVRAWREQQEQARQAKLPKWHAKHPERAAFQQNYAEYSRLLKGWSRAETPEAKAAFASEIEQIPADARQEIAAFEQHKRSTQERLAVELAEYGSLEEMVAAKAAAIVQQERAKAEAETKVNQWFDAPDHKPIIEHTSPAMQEALNDGVPLPYVQAMAQMRYKLDLLESRMAGNNQVVAGAQARTDLAKANAAITRDTSGGARRADPVAIAKERGIETSSAAYVELLHELSAKKLI